MYILKFNSKHKFEILCCFATNQKYFLWKSLSYKKNLSPSFTSVVRANPSLCSLIKRRSLMPTKRPVRTFFPSLEEFHNHETKEKALEKTFRPRGRPSLLPEGWKTLNTTTNSSSPLKLCSAAIRSPKAVPSGERESPRWHVLSPRRHRCVISTGKKSTKKSKKSATNKKSDWVALSGFQCAACRRKRSSGTWPRRRLLPSRSPWPSQGIVQPLARAIDKRNLMVIWGRANSTLPGLGSTNADGKRVQVPESYCDVGKLGRTWRSEDDNTSKTEPANPRGCGKCCMKIQSTSDWLWMMLLVPGIGGVEPMGH